MNIVVGFTPSAQGRAALAAAVRQGKLTGSVVVVANHVYADCSAAPATASEDAVRDAIRDAGGDSIEVRLLTDARPDAGEFLLETVEKEHSDLLVIGLRRKSPIGKLSLGASARRVILQAPCRVLAVKEPA